MQGNRHSYVYYALLSLLLAVVCFVQTSTPLVPELFGVRAMPAYIFMLCFAAFSGQGAAIIAGLLLGIATDVCSAAPDGFNAVTMMVAGLLCSLLATYLFNARLPAAAVLMGIFTALYYLLYWLVCVAFKGYDGVWLYLVRFSLPSAIYTWLFVFLFWPLVQFLSRQNLQTRKPTYLE